MKLKVGIIFGGPSREREVSFAGGRTVYDNLDKSLFEAVPVFVDSFRNFWLIDWEYIYKGSIRDFYPPGHAIPPSEYNFQYYAENLGDLDPEEQEALLRHAGKKVDPSVLNIYFDFAFLCLHGPYGEDGRIQGLFEFHGIPYSGSGILPSSIGIDKVVQRGLMEDAGFPVPDWFTVTRNEWKENPDAVFREAQTEVRFPLVVKAATQGSSIGVTIVQEEDQPAFYAAMDRALFIQRIRRDQWEQASADERIFLVRQTADIREGVGLPALADDSILIHSPDRLLAYLTERFNSDALEVVLEAADTEYKVMIESFIEGREFSCIVLQNTDNTPIALPPTEIRKGRELFDYRSKYLPGLSRKITPIAIEEEQIQKIRKSCEQLFSVFGFDVYARIDGFIQEDGTVYLNDPNTTSGMMPSSFFFHQAAEIGLNPSQFLTYIIAASLESRIQHESVDSLSKELLVQLQQNLRIRASEKAEKKKVAVILGGYSSERHISVESGRNIYEKLSSSEKYQPVPVFLSGSNSSHQLFKIPVNILLKDNADDILEKINHYQVHPVIDQIVREAGGITSAFGSVSSLDPPQEISYDNLAAMADMVFIALHGRPGEDGAVQEKLDALGIPYNGSGVNSSRITINKFVTNEILKSNGFLTAEHRVVEQDQWQHNREQMLAEIREKFTYPFIAKPVDDGCSSAVKKIKTDEELIAFANLIFRTEEELEPESASILHLKPKEEFPCKKQFLIEELITRKDAVHFLEITGGLLTRYTSDGDIEYEMFEASEALAEGEVLSLEEKFLAGQGQNITPARYARDEKERQLISDQVKEVMKSAAQVLNIQGYARIDAFVRIYSPEKVEVIFVEVNSLPGMTPATCIFHQSAISGYKPLEFIDNILSFGVARNQIKA